MLTNLIFMSNLIMRQVTCFQRGVGLGSFVVSSAIVNGTGTQLEVQNVVLVNKFMME